MGEGISGGDEGSARDLSPTRQRLLVWGRQSQVDSDWIRSQSPSVGLDSSKMVLGHVLRMIISDDLNSYIYLHDFIKDQDTIEGSRGNALLRLDWELGLEGIPDKVKEKLSSLRDGIGKSDWMEKAKYEASKDQFVKAAAELTSIIAEDERLSGAMLYYDTHYREIPVLPKTKIDITEKME